MKHVYSFITKKLCLLVLLSGTFLFSFGQTTISTETGTNYTGANGVTGNAAITFAVENTSASAKILTQVDVFFNPSTVTSGTVCTLWYSTTSLGGAPTITTPVWTSIATSAPITFTASGYYPVFTGLNFTLPATSQIRFAVQSSGGITYSGAAGPPSPNIFTAGGVNLETFDYQLQAGNVGYGGSFPSPANNPRAFTGRITFIASTPCVGTPAPGNTVSTANPVCPGASFTLSPQNATAGSGVTYQYQSSPDGVTWTDVAGATSSTYTTNTNVTRYYRLKVTCSGNTATSNPIQITVNSPSNCYCTPPATNCNFSDVITNVTLGTINNTSACSPNGYVNYTTQTAANYTTNLTTSTTVPMSVTVGPGGTEYVGVWIDYNQNGVFEASEFTALGSANGAVITSNLNIPATATAGATRMRVRVQYNVALTGADACLGYTYGETEDYKVTIVINTCVAGSFTSQPSNVSITCNSNASFTATTNNGTALTYQWQESTNGGTSFTNLTNTGVYSGVTTTTLTITAAPASMNNNRYRLQVSGQCTPANTFSNPATLTVTQPAAPTVSPANPSICQGGIVPLIITSAGSPSTSVFPSGPIAVVVPDNSLAGATHTIPVSGIPAGSVITGITVTVNMTHTYIGDEVFALKAPNGSVLNLDYYLSATGGGPYNPIPSAQFNNTRFSSAGTVSVGSGSVPFNGIYKADGYVGAGPTGFGYPNTNTGPTGYSATVATFPGLYSVPNGNWTLAMYDGGAGDIGTLTSWSVTISYGSPSTGVWSPNTGLFTDAAGTIPYTGTSVNTVYAKPAATSTYSVSVSQGGCPSPATSVTVTVNTPTTITQPTPTAVCAGSNTSFSVTAAGTGPFTYQWQVSTDNGATYNNISGANSSTYAIAGATTNMNGYKYRVVVTGAAPCSPVTSSAVTLTVNPLPVLTISASPRTKLIPTTTTTLTGNVTPASTGGTYTWFLNGNPVPSAIRNTLLVDIDHIGDYTALFTDANGCTSALSNTLTISDTASGKIFLYPNPNNGKFHVRFYTQFYDPSVAAPPGVSNIEVRYISVYDMLGHRILDKPFSVYAPYGSMDVDLTPFGKGVYFIMVKDVQGKKLASGRAVVQ